MNEKEIEFTLCIYLNQNDDFFVFIFNNQILGNSIYNILSLLKNYYENKYMNLKYEKYSFFTIIIILRINI